MSESEVRTRFFIAVVRAIKKLSFFFFSFNPPLSLFLKKFFFYKNCFSLFCRHGNFGLVLGLSSLLLLFLHIHIGLNSNFKKCLNHKANHENLDSSCFVFFLFFFFQKIGLIKKKENVHLD